MTITDTNWCQSKLLKRQKLILFADIKVFSMLNRSSLPVFVLSFLMVPDRDRRCLINEGYAERVWLKYSQESCSTVLIPVCVCPVCTHIVTGFFHTSINNISLGDSSESYWPCFFLSHSERGRSSPMRGLQNYMFIGHKSIGPQAAFSLLAIVHLAWWVCCCVPAFLHASTLQCRMVWVWTSKRTKSRCSCLDCSLSSAEK